MLTIQNIDRILGQSRYLDDCIYFIDSLDISDDLYTIHVNRTSVRTSIYTAASPADIDFIAIYINRHRRTIQISIHSDGLSALYPLDMGWMVTDNAAVDWMVGLIINTSISMQVTA
jgi:hypothetical protein